MAEIDDIKAVINHFFDDDNATDLLVDLWVIMQAWDDAEDGEDADHSYSYKKAMIDLPMNPLYLPCSVPFLVQQAYIKWCAANDFERENQHLEKAFMLRADYYNIIIAVYSAVYGYDAAAEQAAQIWSCYGEQLDEFINEVRLCRVP